MTIKKILCYYKIRVGIFWRYERDTVRKNKNNKNKLGGKAIILSTLGLAALSSAVVFGATPNSFAATDVTAEVTVNVGSVIAITAEDIDIDISAPSPAGVFATGAGQVSVATNDSEGYSIYLTSNDEFLTSLDHETIATSKIESIATSETISGATTKFATNNTWGWSNDGSVFYPVQAKGTHNDELHSAITRYRETNGPSSNGDVSTLTVGATVDSTLTSGTYSGTLLLTAIVNSIPNMCAYEACDE